VNELPPTYVISARGWDRVWTGILALRLPTLPAYYYIFPADPACSEWHVSGAAKVLWVSLMLFVRTVLLDIQIGRGTRLACVFGRIIHSKVWNLAEFTRIALNHGCGGSDTDTFQSDVGIRHRSGVVVWLRAFLVESGNPSPEALAFAKQLSDTTGLRYEK